MEDAKIAGILADEFNKLSNDEEANREDEELLAWSRGKKSCLCNVMGILGVRDLIDIECKTVAYLKSDIENALVPEGYWEQRLEQVAKVLVEIYYDAVEMLENCVLSDAEAFDARIVKREAARYLRLLHLGVIKPDGTAVVSIERMPLGD